MSELGESGPASLHPVAWRPVLVVAGLVAAGHLAIASRYGWHRDEMYYVASGRHPAWGYPDQPPLTPMLARLAAAFPGGVWPLRILTIAIQCGVIVVGALIARELGGARRAQTIAAGCMAGCGVFVGASLFLGTTVVDQLCWAVVIWLLVRAIGLAKSTAWIWVGLAAGIGLENKSTVAVLLVAMLIGLLVWRRSVLASSGPWIAAAIAAVCWAPNVWWDATHHWINLDMANAIADKQGGIGGSLAQLPLLLVLLPTPLLVVVWIRGVRWAITGTRARVWGWIVVGAAIATLALTLGGGKPYYPAPLLVPLFAMGAVATEQRDVDRGRWSRTIPRLVVASALVSPLLALPYLTPRISTALRPVAKDPMETYGWPTFARDVVAAARADPTATAVYVSNYGEAGALDLYGRGHGLHLPVVAGQNGYRYWGHPSGTPRHILAVGEFDRSFLERSWTHVRELHRFRLGGGLENEETENAAFFECSGAKGSWSRLWPRLTYLS